MNRWKDCIVASAVAVLSVAFATFILTGYTALYWAWVRGDLGAALPFLPWARYSGALAIAAAAIALGILFASRTFPISSRSRLVLSLLATLTIAFFAEFRNEGKFQFKALVHLFGPGTWIHQFLNRTFASLGDFLYRAEYSHWNDFLMGPAIVSVLFSLVFFKVSGALRNQRSLSFTTSSEDSSAEVDHALRFARILMNVGLFWFFIQAWGEKAGYLSNPHSSDEIDLPFEFAGTMVGFWMARVLTKPFDNRVEKFRSTFVLDFLVAGVIGLLYTVIVGSLTESVARSVAYALFPVVPSTLNAHEYTALQRHIRPFELLLLAGAMWWSLNRFFKPEEITRITGSSELSEVEGRNLD